jgi:hypothetical protein
MCFIATGAFSQSAMAQDPYEGDLFLPIKNVKAEWLDDNVLRYHIMVDLEMLKENNQHVLSELAISTTQGVVQFNPAHLKDPSLRMVVGTLEAPDVQKFQATKVVGNLDGKVYDLTENAYNLRGILPDIDFPSRSGKVCPNTTLDLATIEGVYKDMICGDYCHTIVTVDGEDIDYAHENHLSYFFSDRENLNTKIKAQLREYLRPPVEGSTDCDRGYIITDIVVLK